MLNQLTDIILKVRSPHPVRVAIDGIDNAGKTSMSDELAKIIAGSGRPVIQGSLDGFHQPKSVRYRRGTDSPEGYYWDSYSYDKLRKCLLIPLGPGGDHLYQLEIFDYRRDKPIHLENRQAEKNAILLFDGIFLLRPEIRNDWDMSIFLKVEFEEALRRALDRDQYELGSREAATTRYQRRYIPGQMIYLTKDQPEDVADIVVENTNLAGPVILLVR